MDALLLAKARNAQETEETIGRAIRIGKDFGHFHHSAYNIASAWAALNRPDEAVKWIQVAADDGFPCYSYFEADPNLEPLRDHPGFTALMSTLRQQWHRFSRIAPHRKGLVVGLRTAAPSAWR